jgi:hypothetical protein
MTWGDRAGELAQMLAVPHGFTLAVSATLAIAVHEDGYPGDIAVWWFVTAGGVAFCLAVLLSRAHARDDLDRPRGWGLFNLVAMVVVPVAVVAGRWIGQPDVRMAVTGFVCVATYLALLTAFVRLAPAAA